ncbi:MFS transporter, partial [Burkholderia contaminans]
MSGPMAAADSGFRPSSVGLTTFGLALAVFMQVLDGTVPNVSLPTIAGHFGVSTTQSAQLRTPAAVTTPIPLPCPGFPTHRPRHAGGFRWA